MIFQPREPVPDSPILYEIRNKDLKEELLLFSKTEAPYFFSADSIIIVSIKRQPPFTYYRIFYEENADVVMMNKNVFFAKIDNTVIAIRKQHECPLYPRKICMGNIQTDISRTICYLYRGI